VTYSREELDWIEAEWAIHLHGRQAFLSREDFLQVQAWEGEGVPADLVVHALAAFFERRSKRAKPRTFVALSQVGKDVAKAMKLRENLAKAGPAPGSAREWGGVKEPLGSNPRALAAYEAWAALKAASPPPDSPGFLEHFDREREAFRRMVDLATAALGGAAEELRTGLRGRLLEAGLEEDGILWKRAWSHHWGRLVCEAWGIPQ
jgi:hypothetical protein